MRRSWARAIAWLNTLNLSENTILIVLGVGVGVASGLGVVLFYKLIDIAFTVFFRIPSERVSRGVFLAYRPIVTSAGLVLAWLLVRRLTHGTHESMNVPDVQLAVARRGGYLAPRVTAARTAASAITMGSGGSAGSEGPVAVLGSTIGSLVGRMFFFDSSRTRVLVGAGAAAGIAAAFNAPLAGAFFALEEILGTFSAAAFAPVVISSVAGAIVSRAVLGNHPAFPIPREYGFTLSSESILLYPLLGLVCGVVAVLFIRFFFRLRAWNERHTRHPLLIAAAAGATVGLLVYLSHGVLVGYGHLAVRLEVFGRIAWYSLVLLAIGKIVATSLTLNLGGSGGVFTPTLYIGAATGGAFGVAARELAPALQIAPEPYALVGMGALVAAATNAPITGILIVFEMTNDYAIVPALMLVVAIATVVARRLEPDSLYSGELRRRGEMLENVEHEDVFSLIRVSDVVEPAPGVPATATLPEVLDHFARQATADIPVLNARGQVVGLIALDDLARMPRGEEQLGSLAVAADLAVPTEVAVPHDTLIVAIQKIGKKGLGTLPVIDPKSGVLLGVVTRRHILDAYERRL